MGTSEEGKPCKPEKPSSPAPAPDQTKVHAYPDWAAIQAYYGPRVAVPPYFNSAVASGHAPHPYMWGPPQAMMPPYGAPYAAIYAHGGIYAHPGVPLVATPSSMGSPAKSSGNTDRGLMKKLKMYDGLAMSIGNGNADSSEGGLDHGVSRSAETGGSSDGSDGNTSGVCQNGRKRSREGKPAVAAGGDGKSETQNSPVPAGGVNGASSKVMGVTVTHASAAEEVGTVLSPSMTTALVPRNTSGANPKTSPTSVPQPCVMPGEAWLQSEREMKRERRKQSNRESARRSRLRRQAEAEGLTMRVESLAAENTTLKSEINRLTENSEKLKLENAILTEKLKNAQLGKTKERSLDKIDDERGQHLSTENLLSRVNNSGSGDKGLADNSNSGAKLHQLLGKSLRKDAVAAG